jgi:hypothetical protein
MRFLDSIGVSFIWDKIKRNFVRNNKIASAEELGLVRVGDGLSIDPVTGILRTNVVFDSYDSVNHLITINDGTNSTTYILTPYEVLLDYYVGWTNKSKSEFYDLSSDELLRLSNHYLIQETPNYTSPCIGTLFFLMFRMSKLPSFGNLHPGGGLVDIESTDLDSKINILDFISGGNCTHPDIVIGDYVYKVFAIKNSDLVNDSNIITIKFNN